jgi:hypothetical protein
MFLITMPQGIWGSADMIHASLILTLHGGEWSAPHLIPPPPQEIIADTTFAALLYVFFWATNTILLECNPLGFTITCHKYQVPIKKFTIVRGYS